MAAIQQAIIDKFLEELAKSEYFDAERVARLRKLLTDDKAVKADQLVELFKQPQSGGFE